MLKWGQIYFPALVFGIPTAGHRSWGMVRVVKINMSPFSIQLLPVGIWSPKYVNDVITNIPANTNIILTPLSDFANSGDMSEAHLLLSSFMKNVKSPRSS